jgi:rhomboid protease GluP
MRSSILCPNCRKLISKDEPRCPHCGLKNPASPLKYNFWTRGLMDPFRIIRWIIYLNAGMYVLTLLLNPMIPRFSYNPLMFLSPENRSLLLMGATGTIPVGQLGRWWTVISANFLHGSILHIFFNMFAFYQIAPLVVREYGVNRMIILYTLGGVFGFVVSFFAGVTFTIGASAALCSLIGASLYFGKSLGGSYGQAIYRQLGAWTLGIFLFGILFPGINNWGHGGGLLAGAAMGYMMGYSERKRETVAHRVLAGACALVTALVLVWAVASGLYYRTLT